MRYLVVLFLLLSGCESALNCDDVMDKAINCFKDGYPAIVFPIDTESVSVVCMEDISTQPIEKVSE